MAEPGDRVKITAAKEAVEGTLMPTEDSDSIFVKLKNGYNIGIDKKSIKKIDILEKAEKPAKKEKEQKNNQKNPKLPAISILHTGGTIASKVDYATGGVVAAFSAEEIISMFPELTKIANIKSSLVSNMMSEDIRFSHYKMIAEAVIKEVKEGAEGIIIGHGTDTLAVTSAALSFMLEDIPIPVILVGAQRSSDRPSTDALMNLVCAAEFIAKTDFSGVAICMHKSMTDDICAVFPAAKTRKLHTSRRDAFKAVNDTEIAEIDYKTRKISFLKKDYMKKDSRRKINAKLNFEDKVAIIKTYPNMLPDLIDALREKKYKGFVLEGTGIGQAPTNIKENIPNYDALKKFIDDGGIVVLTSQCIFGIVHDKIYKNCRRLADIGVIFGKDMLTETAFVKLAWLLGNYKKDEVKRLIVKDLRGEISERTDVRSCV